MSAAALLRAAKAKGVMLATAESCTAGLISGAITDQAGSSAIFDRGFVTYSNAAKTAMLDVPATMIAQYGAVSEEVAQAMVAGALAHSDAQIAVAVTGVAGPGGTPEKPEGMVCFGIGAAGGIFTETHQFGPIGRRAVRQATVDHALALCLAAVVRYVR